MKTDTRSHSPATPHYFSRWPRRAANAAAALAIAIFAAAGQAQVRQVNQGNILDANPQLGAGGSNAPVQGYVPINGNAIIYGDVSGLAYFHGTTGTSSPNQFRGTLGTATLNNFARTSAGGIPMAAGAVPAQPYYLPSSLVSGSQGALYASPIGSGFDTRLLPGSSVSPTVTGYSPSAPVNATAYQPIDRSPAMVPTDTSSTSAAGELLSSPLWFSRQSVPENNLIPSTLEKLETPETAAPQDKNKTQRETPDTQPPSGPTARIDARVRGQSDYGTSRSTDENGNPALAANEPRDLLQRGEVSKTYTTLLADLAKARRQEDAAATAAAQKEPTPAPATASGAASLPATASSRPLVRPGAATRRFRLGPSPMNLNPLEDEPDSVLRAGQHITPLPTLADIPAAGQPTSFDVVMKQGETLLKAGKYLEAVDVYKQALVAQPDNALAIIGRAHAELAAGMYMSAAHDLKFVFARHPQLISVRYQLAEFIPSKRLDMVFNDLLALTTQERSTDTASFLYCYVAYNTGHSAELQKELAHWGIRPQHDMWQAVAAKAWGK